MKFKRFTKPQFLKGIRRELLDQLFGKFSVEFATRKIALPTRHLSDDDYFTAVANLALALDGLPDALIEALFAIEAVATAEGQERLETAVVKSGLGLTFREESSHGDIAVQLYLAHPALVVAQHNEARMGRLSAFEYFGGACRTGQCAAWGDKTNGADGTDGARFVVPNRATLDQLAGDLDVWFKEHHRGQRTTRIEVYAIDGEFWFMVRHGDTFTRTAKVENERLEMMHFRPAKDDVIVYAPKRNELRVHAGTKGEKELYRRVFGQRLFGNAEYFCERKAYTLEPLREDCADALDTRGLPGVRQSVLREVKLAWGAKKDEFMVRGGMDIHGSARSRGRNAIPEYGTIVRAVFDFNFANELKPRRVEVRIPNTVKMVRGCDARVVHEWLSERGFRTGVVEASRVVDGEAVAA